jgi:transposase
VVLDANEREVLERYVRRRKSSARTALRAGIVLRCADGWTNQLIASKLNVTPGTVSKWRGRFARKRLDGLLEEPRVGRPRQIGDDKIEQVLVDTLESTPRNATHWSTRSMARHSGLSQTSIGRIWRAFGLTPHRVESFVLSKDPQFIEKVRDVVGLYLDPPESALVLCVDEKSQIQALDRSQPVLPMRPGQAERRTHDYTRYGTSSLFAALDVATGRVIGRCFRRHRAKEFKKFLADIDAAVPASLDVHVILDNYATHKTPSVKRWLLQHPRFVLHFTPTKGSWLNQVERWFGLLTERQLKRGVHQSVPQLEKAIYEYIEIENEDPKPFKWVKTADEILEKIARFAKRTKQAAESATSLSN